MTAKDIRDSTLRHLGIACTFTAVTVVMLGLVYPFVMTLLAQLFFPAQAGGAIVYRNGQAIGSDIVGQLWTKPQYFHGRPSAAGSGYDPTATSGTSLGPTSKKLMDATKATIAAMIKENPDAIGPVPMDLITSSASGIDPDISPEAAYYQASRVAAARHMAVSTVNAVIDEHVLPRELGFLGEPRVNVLQLNLALDAAKR